MDLGRYQVYFLGAITIIGFPLIGFIINYFFQDDSFWLQFESPFSLLYQIVVGVLYGTLSGIICWFVINSSFMRPSRIKYVSVMRELNMSYFDIVFISICAGVGEEILFRGVLQDFMGIIITSVIFVAIHGYIKWKDWRITIYGLVMILIIIGIGIMFETMGVVSPAIAHTVIDIILLTLICKGNIDPDVLYISRSSDEEE